MMVSLENVPFWAQGYSRNQSKLTAGNRQQL